jgi:hypothetical protein
MLVKDPDELFARYILYDEAPVTALQLTVKPDEDCTVTLTPVGAAKAVVVPLTTADCAPSVPFTALTLYQYVVPAVSSVSV